MLKTIALAALLAVSAGCNSALFTRRTVLVRSGQPMILREKLKNVDVFVVIDGKWEESTVDEIAPGAYITWRDPKTGAEKSALLRN